MGSVQLLAVKVPHVKDIHDLLGPRTDLCNPNIQLASKQGVGNQKQQAGIIVGKDFNNGKKA